MGCVPVVVAAESDEEAKMDGPEKTCEQLAEQLQHTTSRIDELEWWRSASTRGWLDVISFLIFGVVLFIPVGVWFLFCGSVEWTDNQGLQKLCSKKWICSKRSERPSRTFFCCSPFVNKAGDLLNWWGCTIYTAQEVEEELQSLQDDYGRMMEELYQQCGLNIAVTSAWRMQRGSDHWKVIRGSQERRRLYIDRLLIVVGRLSMRRSCSYDDLSPVISHCRLSEQLRCIVQEQLDGEELEDSWNCLEGIWNCASQSFYLGVICDCCGAGEDRRSEEELCHVGEDRPSRENRYFVKDPDGNTFCICEDCFDQIPEAEQAELTMWKMFKGLNSLEDVLPQPTPVPTHGGNAAVDPVDWGMTVAQLLLFVEACMATKAWDELSQSTERNKENGHVNGYQLCNSYVKPWTKGTGCSVSLLMNTKPRTAEVMISHGDLTRRGVGSLSGGMCSMG